MALSTAEKIRNAMTAANLSQRELAAATGISQPTISRIITGERPAKMPELVAIAQATGLPLAGLTRDPREERVLCAARATGTATMQAMRAELLGMLALEAHLDEYGIPAAVR